MKSTKKLNLPPIPSNSLQTRTPSANQPSNEVDKEKIKKIPIPQTNKTIESNHTLLEQIPKYKPPKNQMIKSNPIIEETKTYIENLKKGAYNILVCVRCRPLSQLERQLSTSETIRIMDNKMLVLMDPIEYNGPTTVFKNRNREQTYAFDFAFDKYTSQVTVFDNSTKFLIDGVVNGYNATVFAYGATGAGKTYTMLGNDINPGIMPLTLGELFQTVNRYKERVYKVKFWYLEIYNENIRDLLKFVDKPNSNFINDDNEYLDLREDPIKGIMVSGITEVNVDNKEDMLKILKRGNRNRTQEATGANETSSRSHAILQVSIEYKEKNSGIDYEIKYSKLSLVDLAGSERASATQNRGMRLIEGANINRSLLTLGNCINALCDATFKGIKKPYIPYRDSKLTRLLKDSLGGNARTVMIANISPSINAFDDTYNTLKYANRAKNIKTVVTRNVVNAQYHISNYVNIINGLKNEITKLKKQMQLQRVNSMNKNLNLMDKKSSSNDDNTNEGNVVQNQTQGSFATYNNSSNYFLDDKFVETLKEIKRVCENQFTIKQKIIFSQNEINKISDIIEMNKNITSINNNLSNLISSTGTKNSKENSPSSNENNNQETSNENNLNNLNDKLVELQNILSNDQNKFKDYNKLIEKLYKNNSIRNNFAELQKEFLISVIKNNNNKLQMLDIKYKNMLIKIKNDIKNEYIKELEQQIKFRDDIIKENNIDISSLATYNNLIKDLETLNQNYRQKLSKNYNSNFFSFNKQDKSNSYTSIYSTNPKQEKNDIFIPKNSNKSQLNKINSKYNILNQNINNINSVFYKNKKFSQNKITVIKNDHKSLCSDTKGNSRQFQSKGKQPNINDNKNLKRNNKSYAYKEKGIKGKGNESKRCYINKKEFMELLSVGHNRSFNEEENFHKFSKYSLKSNSIKKKNEINSNDEDGRFITFEEMPHVKKRELNFLLYERNQKRQKFLDKINAGNRDML